MKKKKRIVVTGMGVVSCFGNDVDTFYNALLEGRSGVVPITEFPCENFATRFAGAIREFDTGEYVAKKQARRVDPFISYALVAGKKALESGKLDSNALSLLDKKRCGVIIGSGMGGMSIFFDGANTLFRGEHRRLTPFFVPFIIPNMGGALLAIDLGFSGPNFSISTACATSNYCIMASVEQIRLGNADLMLCGGSEAALSPIGVSGFIASKALSTRNDNPAAASRPWDKGRDGFVMGEGAGVLLLESLEHALSRGAPIFAELLGGATNCDAYHMTDPRADGEIASLCIDKAIQDAGIEKGDVNYINAHATSTIVGDICEINALSRVFGAKMSDIKMNATKSMTGHCLGAAGGVEAVVTVKAITTQMLHPTINLDDPVDEVKDIDTVRYRAKPHKVKAALSNSFGFGGHNSVLVFAPYT